MRHSSKLFVRTMLLAAMGLPPLFAFAGGIQIESGSLAPLRQEHHINLEFDFSEMKVGHNNSDCVPEQEFIESQVARLNAKKAGAGDAWKMEWIGQRLSRFQPKFKQLLNKQFGSENIPLEFGEFKDAKYTLILKPTAMLGLSLTADALFVETGNRSNSIATVTMIRISGQDNSGWSPGWIDGVGGVGQSEAYARAGKELGVLIRSKIK